MFIRGRRRPFVPRAELRQDVPGKLRRWVVFVSRGGSAYRATTFPNSNSIYIQTGAKGRPAASKVVERLMPIVRAAIARALEVGEDELLRQFHEKQKEYGYED